MIGQAHPDLLKSMFNPFRTRTAPVPASHSGSAAPSELVDPRVMQEIGHLELISRTVVDGLLAGKHRSTTKGGCSEFAQHRQYAIGDEIRQIDWQVYARNDRYFVKCFEEETNLQALVAIDATGSMKFALSTMSKLDYARRAAACLSRLLLHQRDAVGVAILNEEQPLFVPPRQHAAHLKAILAALQSAQAGGADSIGAQIRTCLPRLRRRGLFVLFSDCFGEPDELAQSLRVVRARGHDMVVMNVLAPEEVHFQFRHWSAFQSLELAGQRLRLDPASVREEYLKQIRRHLERLEEMVIGIGGDYVRLTTNRDLADGLAWFLRNRMARGR